jgi:hypothetical protein
MTDFAKISRSKSIVSETIYILLNILLAVTSTVLVVVTNSWIISCLFVVLSKWRIFAVRPRFWIANIKSNMIDFIVGVSFVFLIYLAGNDALALRMVITVFYAIWLLVIKPRSSQLMVDIQSGMALFLGTMTAVSLTFELPSAFLVVVCFVVGYSVARHITLYEDDAEVGFTSIIFGIVLAELAWISYHWLIAYDLPTTELRVPQLSIIATLFGFTTLAIYRSATNHEGKAKSSEVIMPIIFSIIVTLILVIVFSEKAYNI